MITKIRQNRRQYHAYNTFRKKIFAELSPRESQMVLYMLPWLLSINHPDCPGYIPGSQKILRVFGVDNIPEIKEKETGFKRLFNVTQRGTLLKPPAEYYRIEGLYTIGSIGTVSQTSHSDCDMWVVYDKTHYDEAGWIQLNQKLNLIKDWLDMNVRMPIFFFISDVTDIRNNNFGSVDSESCGSAQRNVLKEEFYRTTIVICGKLPLWWICFDENEFLDYHAVGDMIENHRYGFHDMVIDFGNLEKIDKDEYFGAALWQFHKSLTRPLKSIIKMVLLKRLLEASDDELICHQFRRAVLTNASDLFPDPSIFTIVSLLDYFVADEEKIQTFLKECFYLRCEIRPYEKRPTIKKQLTGELFKSYPLDIKTRIRLSNFNSWEFTDQIELGNSLFELLLKIYRDIFTSFSGVQGQIDEDDLTILGRIIATCYRQKEGKVPFIQKPTGILNIHSLIISLENGTWYVYPNSDKTRILVSSPDVLYVVAFLVHNDLFESHRVSMEPNPSSVTLQEINNLGRKMRDCLGICDISGIDHAMFLKDEHMVKLLLVVSFEKSPWEKDINDFGVIYKNSWGELFVNRFKSPRKLESFLKKAALDKWFVETGYYVQRNSTYYEKIIERLKKIIMSSTYR
jgi:adenylate cyclase, class 1